MDRLHPGSRSFVASLVLGALGVFGAACSVEAVDDAGEAQMGGTHALVAVTRTEHAGAPGDVRADAFAGFLRAPAGADPSSALRVAGLSAELPATGECRRTAHGQRTAAPGLTRVELLDAGEVTLAAGDSIMTLAPRAFPTLTDAISGVVYTTRDRAAQSLPTASAYTVATSGGSALGPLSGVASAPEALSGVEVAGVPLAEVETLRAGEELRLAWQPGAAGDRVYVELDGAAGAALCAFRDDAGLGSIGAPLVPAAGAATLSVHRLREASFSDSELSRGELRFDYELTTSVSFE